MPPEHVYLLQSRKTQWYKIGFSSDPARRVAELNKEMEDLDWRLVAELPSKDPRRVERAFHAVFASRRITRGKEEWFVLGTAEVELFQALASEVVGGEKTTRPSWWPAVLGHLTRDQRKPLSAFIYEEVSAAWFEGTVLRVLFPVTLSTFVERASGPVHTKPLQEAVEAVYGKRPTEVRCEVQ